MRINLIKKASVEEFVLKYPNSRSGFANWISKLKYADWTKPEDIKNTFNSADLLGAGSNRVVFNLCGNNYRVIAKYSFGETRVHLFLKWVGSHAEYDKLCNKNKQFIIDEY